jgi:hypothetical protein
VAAQSQSPQGQIHYTGLENRCRPWREAVGCHTRRGTVVRIVINAAGVAVRRNLQATLESRGAAWVGESKQQSSCLQRAPRADQPSHNERCLDLAISPRLVEAGTDQTWTEASTLGVAGFDVQLQADRVFVLVGSGPLILVSTAAHSTAYGPTRRRCSTSDAAHWIDMEDTRRGPTGGRACVLTNYGSKRCQR